MNDTPTLEVLPPDVTGKLELHADLMQLVIDRWSVVVKASKTENTMGEIASMLVNYVEQTLGINSEKPAATPAKKKKAPAKKKTGGKPQAGKAESTTKAAAAKPAAPSADESSDDASTDDGGNQSDDDQPESTDAAPSDGLG